MSQRFVSYLNGRYSDHPPMISVYDAGFVQGLAVSEQLRTFGGELYRLDGHLARLRRSLEIVGVTPPVSLEELGQVVKEIAARNHPLLPVGSDLGVTLFITPGPYPGMTATVPIGPTVCVHAQPLAFASWSQKYEAGQRLVIVNTRQVSPRNWPPELKCRSRMHYFLADREAQGVDADSRALLLDLEGFISEASTANVFCHFQGEGCVSPPRAKILPGVTLDALRELAAREGISFLERDLRPEELRKADEILLCSTSPCLLPVTAVDGQSVSGGRPGPIYRRLLSAWSDSVGVDIVEQAQRFAGGP